MAEPLGVRAYSQIESKIEEALLDASVISVTSTVNGDGSIEIDAIRLRLRDGRIIRVRASVLMDEGILLETVIQGGTLRRMTAQKDFGGDA